MTSIERKRRGYTKLGFSKNGFSACSNWNYCDMGKKECYLIKKDPEVKDYCFCYLRHHKNISNNDKVNIFHSKNDDVLDPGINIINIETTKDNNDNSVEFTKHKQIEESKEVELILEKNQFTFPF